MTHSGADPIGQGARRSLPLAAPALLAAATVGLQMSYPLLHGGARNAVTLASVASFCAASLGHALATRGPRAAGWLLLAAGGVGWSSEVLGLHTGVPFGRYAYTTATLGPELAGVPVAVALAWVMMAWPAALAARRLARGFPARVAVGAWALASWDLFLDPQMVAAGHWTWLSPGAHLPGVADVPLSNFAGWAAVSVVISVLVQVLLQAVPDRGEPRGDAAMLGLYLWTYASSVLALLAFLGLPAAAGWGAVGMGVVALPLAARLVRDARPGIGTRFEPTARARPAVRPQAGTR